MLSVRFPLPSISTLSPSTSQNKRNDVSPKFYKVQASMLSNKYSYPNTHVSWFSREFHNVNATAASDVAIDGVDGRERSLVLPEGLKPELMPKHVAIIMDGHRRWADERGLTIEEGHRAGYKTIVQLARLCSKWGIKTFTAFSFSTENWSRPKEEVDCYMSIVEETVRNEIHASSIGDKSRLPKSLQDALTLPEDHKDTGKEFRFVMALNYSGRNDVLRATRSIATKVKNGVIAKPEDIDETLFEQELDTKLFKYPNPDLLIRTSGEIRISNFLLWQLAYTELYFTETMFPDFGEAELKEALLSFQQRDRRYGGRK